MSDPAQNPIAASEPRLSSGADFVSALVLAAFAAWALIEALTFDAPERWTTAPGLLPFVVGCLLFLMSAALAVGAWRAGAARDLSARLRALRGRGSMDLEQRRTLVLACAICAYVILVGLVDFDWRAPLPFVTLQFSSFELVSIMVVTLLLASFWGGSWSRCVLIAVVGVESIAWIFRYAFAIVMPAAF